MTIVRRVLTTLLIASGICGIVLLRRLYIYPGHHLPLTELLGAAGAFLLSAPAVWIKRGSKLYGALSLSVPCIGSGVVALLLWINLVVHWDLSGSLSAWYAFDWIRSAGCGRTYDGYLSAGGGWPRSRFEPGVHVRCEVYVYDDRRDLRNTGNFVEPIVLSRRTIRLRPRPLLPPRQILQPGHGKIHVPRSAGWKDLRSKVAAQVPLRKWRPRESYRSTRSYRRGGVCR